MKLQQATPESLIPASYNPSVRVGKKELRLLLRSIKKNGILYPLLVDTQMNVIDGHRRLTCAKELNMPSVPIIVSDTKLTRDECYETINTTVRKMSANEMIFVYIKGGKVPSHAEKRIKELESIIGIRELKKLATKFVSTTVLLQGKQIAQYCNEASNEFIKAAILWVIKHKQSYQVRKAIEDRVSKASLKTAILNNRPLKHDWK